MIYTDKTLKIFNPHKSSYQEKAAMTKCKHSTYIILSVQLNYTHLISITEIRSRTETVHTKKNLDSEYSKNLPKLLLTYSIHTRVRTPFHIIAQIPNHHQPEWKKSRPHSAFINTCQLTYPNIQSATLISPGFNPNRHLAQTDHIVNHHHTQHSSTWNKQLWNPLRCDYVHRLGRRSAAGRMPPGSRGCTSGPLRWCSPPVVNYTVPSPAMPRSAATHTHTHEISAMQLEISLCFGAAATALLTMIWLLLLSLSLLYCYHPASARSQAVAMCGTRAAIENTRIRLSLSRFVYYRDRITLEAMISELLRKFETPGRFGDKDFYVFEARRGWTRSIERIVHGREDRGEAKLSSVNGTSRE